MPSDPAWRSTPRPAAAGVRVETLEKICEYLQCQPGGLLVYQPDGDTP
ncbi:helix-turn-helix domain-containing protein [Hydrogenophaga sp. ZJX-1]